MTWRLRVAREEAKARARTFDAHQLLLARLLERAASMFQTLRILTPPLEDSECRASEDADVEGAPREERDEP